MEIRVAVPDAASAEGLVRRLAGAFDPTSVLLDADNRDVCVQTGQDRRQTVVQILDTVEDWLDEAAVDSVTVSLDGCVQTLARPRDWPMARGSSAEVGVSDDGRQ